MLSRVYQGSGSSKCDKSYGKQSYFGLVPSGDDVLLRHQATVVAI